MLANGFYNPKLSALFASMWFSGRFLFGSGYGKKGP